MVVRWADGMVLGSENIWVYAVQVICGGWAQERLQYSRWGEGADGREKKGVEEEPDDPKLKNDGLTWRTKLTNTKSSSAKSK